MPVTPAPATGRGKLLAKPVPVPKFCVNNTLFKVAQGGVCAATDISRGVGCPSPGSSGVSLLFKSGLVPLVERSRKASPSKPTPDTTTWLLYTIPGNILLILQVICNLIVFCPGMLDKVLPAMSKLNRPAVLPLNKEFCVIPAGAVKEVIELLITLAKPFILFSVSKACTFVTGVPP